MAGITVFGFQPGKTLLHRLDARCKLLSLVALGLTTIHARPGGLLLFTFFLLGLMGLARLNFQGLFPALRYLFFFLGFIWVARALFTPGFPLFSISFLHFSHEGVIQGALLCWRMTLVVFLSLIYIAVTRTTQTREAVQRLLQPFPLVPEKRIADMLGLMVRFFPMILDRIGETAQAQQARAVENRKNPVYRFKNLAVPVLLGLFADANILSEAMDARCYTPEQRIDPLPFDRKAQAGLAAVLLVCFLGLIP
ncbi:MAG: energy-coupling factor transporter transmembrane protein EcfT [Deltaproteobacteria bacterium]|nr:energy-coupling factor transporter transmembrane protein EcfT [Deltaproteobacteria bacterium]MBW2042358.1 energy-coupling factor transporter transmembrane protein EcfT [Deltaproteobacteria bacterium]MBW2132917.1 energy-coupling factor transporter transmembrane protein EcfT [Deltaproteobacteria bacterium]